MAVAVAGVATVPLVEGAFGIVEEEDNAVSFVDPSFGALGEPGMISGVKVKSTGGAVPVGEY